MAGSQGRLAAGTGASTAPAPRVPAVAVPSILHTHTQRDLLWDLPDVCYLNSCILGVGAAFPAHSGV